jgi:hypothetical protein
MSPSHPLTRRRAADRGQETWHIYCAGVLVGTIMERIGNPTGTDPWLWQCGFAPGSAPGDCTSGTAESFDVARAAFERAWNVFSAKRTEADFQSWRDEQVWHARKYGMWAAGELLPLQRPSTMMRCCCGEMFDSHDPGASLPHRRHIYAEQQHHVEIC